MVLHRSPDYQTSWSQLAIRFKSKSSKFSNQLALWFRKISEKKSFKMAAKVATLDFQSKQFKLF